MEGGGHTETSDQTADPSASASDITTLIVDPQGTAESTTGEVNEEAAVPVTNQQGRMSYRLTT